MCTFFLFAHLGAYYHEKFQRDNRDLCLSITRTKAPKRSRVASTIQKKNFVLKPPVFPSLSINKANDINTVSTVPVQNTNLPAVSVSPTIFDEVHTHSSYVPDTNVITKVPLHKAVSLDGSSVSNSPDRHQSCSHTSSFPQQQQLKLHQQLEGSIAETCRWLINAGVPISAFDPVAISDISRSSDVSVPQLVPSTSLITPGVPQQSTIIQSDCSNATESPQFNNDNNEIVSNSGMNSLLSAAPTVNANSFDPLSIPFQDGLPDFDDDPLLTAFLPGEQLPVVDDCLWAL